MIDLDTEICVCNSLTINDIADFIKTNNMDSLEELIKNTQCPMGDVCEACHENGYYNDGLNIPMVISMVKRGVV